MEQTEIIAAFTPIARSHYGEIRINMLVLQTTSRNSPMRHNPAYSLMRIAHESQTAVIHRSVNKKAG